MKNHIDRAVDVMEKTDRASVWEIGRYAWPHRYAQDLDRSGCLMPDLPGPDGYNAGLPWWGACDTEVRPAGYEQRIICTDENGPWEATAQGAREFAYALLAAADYAERNQ